MRICIINTGGTISCVGSPLAPMSAEEFKEASTSILGPTFASQFPNLELVYNTELTFPESETGTLDSTNLQPSDWCLIARQILIGYADYDGFVILHGTDSMDFTGAALPFLLNVVDTAGFGRAVLSKPVVLTGSQVPLFHQSSEGTTDLTLNFNTDAFQNFCGAIACAQLRIPEVCVYFDSTLMRGNRVLKTNASEFLAFSSPNYPMLAKVGIECTQYAQRILPGPVHPKVSLDDPQARSLAQDQLAAIAGQISDNAVAQINAFPAAYTPGGASWLASFVRNTVQTGIVGLILESYGEGNFPSGDPDQPEQGEIYKCLLEATQSGVIVMNSTQVIQGIVNDSAYAAGAWLPRVGAMGTGAMTAITSFAKLNVLLSAAAFHGWSREEVGRLMQQNLQGENFDFDRLDSRSSAFLRAGAKLTSFDGSATLVNDPASGPQLLSSKGTLLWAPFGSTEQGLPGLLVMQNDGNLVLRSDNNQPLWATNTGKANGASSALILSGSLTDGSLRLSVFDYSSGTTTTVIYSTNQ